jgi:OmpA-OmpF porin, OOP family
MKLLTHGFVALMLGALLAISVPTEPLAAQQEMVFTLSPMIGGHTFDGAQRLKTSLTYSLGIGYDFTRQWGAEFVFNFTDADGRRGRPKADIYSGRIDGLYHFRPEARLVPYLAAGIGMQNVDYQNRSSDNEALFNWGGGIKYDLVRNLALRADVRHVLTGESVNNLIYSAGLIWRFAPAPAPPAPAPEPVRAPEPARAPEPTPTPSPAPAPEPAILDSDGDGVPDHLDRCPDTPRGVVVDEFGCPVQLTLSIYFDFDKTDIKPEYKSELDRAAAFIAKYPEVPLILVVGHADSTGSEVYNQELSERRAEAVRDYFIVNHDIAADRIQVRGYGESRPIADNATADGRALNRRVEIFFSSTLPE